MITGLLADRKPVDLHIFRNYMSPSQILGKDEYANCNFTKPTNFQEQLLWRAARASGAAPTYYRYNTKLFFFIYSIIKLIKLESRRVNV